MDDPGTWLALNTSIQGQCLNGIVTEIIAAALSDIAGNVYIRDIPAIDAVALPCVLVSPISPTYSPEQGTISAPDVAFRFMVGLVATNQGAINVTLPDRLLWWETIFQLFAKSSPPFSLTGAPATLAQIHSVDVEPGDPTIIEAWKLTFDAAWLAIIVNVRFH